MYAAYLGERATLLGGEGERCEYIACCNKYLYISIDNIHKYIHILCPYACVRAYLRARAALIYGEGERCEGVACGDGYPYLSIYSIHTYIHM